MSERICEICGRKISDDEEFPASWKVGMRKSGVPRIVFDLVCHDCIPEAKRRIRRGLKTTVRRNVWHPAEEKPKFPDGSDSVALVVYDRPKKFYRLHHGKFYRYMDWKGAVKRYKVEKWAYFDELMSL